MRIRNILISGFLAAVVVTGCGQGTPDEDTDVDTTSTIEPGTTPTTGGTSPTTGGTTSTTGGTTTTN